MSLTPSLGFDVGHMPSVGEREVFRVFCTTFYTILPEVTIQSEAGEKVFERSALTVVWL